MPWANEFGQLDHLNRTGSVRQAANKATFLQSGDETMDAGLRTQIERILHLIEGGRHTALFQALVDKAQQLKLFSRQHVGSPFAA